MKNKNHLNYANEENKDSKGRRHKLFFCSLDGDADVSLCVSGRIGVASGAEYLVLRPDGMYEWVSCDRVVAL